jgi:hypothetical protein
MAVSTPADFAKLHRVATHPDLMLSWALVSRLVGLRPAIIPGGTDVSKLEPMDEAEACALYGIATDEFGMYMDFLKMAWAQDVAAADLPVVVELAVKKEKAKPEVGHHEFTDAELELLAIGSFPTTIFDYNAAETNRNLEIKWFMERIVEVRKVFENPMAKELCRMALYNEMRSHRINDMLVVTTDAKDIKLLQEALSKSENDYMKQWDQVRELMPGVVVSAERKEQVTHISSLVRMFLEFKADPANRCRDGVFTDEEIQVMFRRSEQFDPRYRFGWVAAVNEARLGICDPKWKRRMPPEFCRLLDTSFGYALRRVSDRLKLSRPNLVEDGEANEYLPIFQEDTGEVGKPEFDLIAEEISVSVPIG